MPDAGQMSIAAQVPVPTTDQSALGRRGFFFAGGEYIGEADRTLMRGAMYVEVLVPKKVTRRWPLVLFHGAGQTATNWLGTPDGRTGWADWFVSQGYVVYMVDQPARGRSRYLPKEDGPLTAFTVEMAERQFTANAGKGAWPQAKLQTQWPGSGLRGDAVFDEFYRSQVGHVESNVETQAQVQKAGAALLDRIGPAVVLVHSQAGAFGWLLADARPALVKGIVAVEPLGPPFLNAQRARRWGLTDVPLTYDPPVGDPSELKVVAQETPDAPDLVRCQLQAEPARRLPRLAGIPTTVVIAEASYHAAYDHCTSKYLTQAGVRNEMIRLGDRGLRGNGHMVMLEKNSLEIAALLDRWIVDNVK